MNRIYFLPKKKGESFFQFWDRLNDGVFFTKRDIFRHPEFEEESIWNLKPEDFLPEGIFFEDSMIGLLFTEKSNPDHQNRIPRYRFPIYTVIFCTKSTVPNGTIILESDVDLLEFEEMYQP